MPYHRGHRGAQGKPCIWCINLLGRGKTPSPHKNAQRSTLHRDDRDPLAVLLFMIGNRSA